MSGPQYDSGTLADNGCDVAPKCLECPLPVCRYDTEEKPERDRLMWDLRKLGVSRQMIAEKFGVKLRTVDRAIHYRGETPFNTPEPRPERQPVYKQRAPWPEIRRAM